MSEISAPAMSHDAVQALLTKPGSSLEIETKVIDGIEQLVWKAAPVSLRIILELTRLYGDKPYLVYQGESLSYSEHYRKVALLADYLAGRTGLKKGDRVALAMRNYPEWPIVFWAVTAVGGVIVPLNAWWSGAELAYGLSDSGARLLFADRDRFDAIEPHLGDLALEQIQIARDPGEAPGGTGRLEEILSRPAEAGLPEVEIAPEDDATIFYTSGTSGQPKGALGSHRNICTNLLNISYMQAANDLREGRVPAAISGERASVTALTAVPFFHVTGCHAVLVATTASGNKLVMMHRWDPEEALALIEREKVTSFTGVPAMAWQMLESPNFENYDTSSLMSLGTGGAPSAPELVKTMGGKTRQTKPSNGYGLTETSAVVTLNNGDDYRRKPDSVGPPVPVDQVKVVDGDGQEVAPGEVGELCIKGPNVVKGYWNKPEATAAAFTDGWFRSGDLAKIDTEGFVYIVDRIKDMVIRGGENIYCVEVESALYDHSDVMDAAVFGLPHRVLGEEVAAAVHLKPGGSADEDDLKAHLAGKIAAFKVPVLIRFYDQPLTRNANGKIMKREIKAEVAGEMEAYTKGH